MNREQKIRTFLAEKGLTQQVPSDSPRIDCKKGDYFVTDAGVLGTRIDYEYKGIICMSKYVL